MQVRELEAGRVDIAWVEFEEVYGVNDGEGLCSCRGEGV